MTFQEQKATLFDAIQLLMRLYQDLVARAEPLSITCNSELKKTQNVT